jgi:hypothetical protein
MRTTKRSNRASEPTTSKPTFEQAKAAGARIDKLMIKHASVGAQMDRIEQKIADNWRIIDKTFSPGGKRQRTVQHPRPVGDKLIISAGKAISTALKNGSSLEQTKAAALRAATLVGKKYGLSSIPAAVVANIEIRAQRQFKEVSA